MSVPNPLPHHWSVLSTDDQCEYVALCTRFRDAIAQSRRGEGVDVFLQRLKDVRAFIEREPSSMWKRGTVCGVIFLKGSLAINIQQLRLLMGKCKSSINGSLQQLGYLSKPSTPEIDQQLAALVPSLLEDHIEMKKWTIRYGEIPEEPHAEADQKEEIETATDAKRVVKWTFPCPAKCRHKFQDIFMQLMPVQEGHI
jgi:hypothetical protein